MHDQSAVPHLLRTGYREMCIRDRLYAITTIACCILNYADNYPSTKIENRIYYNFKLLAIDKVSKINFLDYVNYGTGKIIQIVENGSEAGKNILFGFFIEIFYSLVPGLLFSLIVLGTYSIRIMFVIGIGYVVIFIVSNLMLKKLYNIKEKVLIETEWTSNKYVLSLIHISALIPATEYATSFDYPAETNKFTDALRNEMEKALYVDCLLYTS